MSIENSFIVSQCLYFGHNLTIFSLRSKRCVYGQAKAGKFNDCYNRARAFPNEEASGEVYSTNGARHI